jgi:hypothetical protein
MPITIFLYKTTLNGTSRKATAAREAAIAKIKQATSDYGDWMVDEPEEWASVI